MKRLLFRIFRMMYAFQLWRRRRFTFAGLFSLLILAVFAAVGVDTTLSMAYQGFSFLACLILFAFLFSIRFREKIVVTRRLPRYATVGTPLTYDIVLTNEGGRVQKNMLMYEDFADPRPDFEVFDQMDASEDVAGNWVDRLFGYRKWAWIIRLRLGAVPAMVKIPPLPPGQSRRVSATMMPNRRGRIALKGITLAFVEPMGICRGMVSKQLPQTFLVLPKRYALPPIALTVGRRHQAGGMAQALSVGDAEEFVSLREYRPGDPMRRIHWRSWAKTGKPIVKEYQEEFFVRHVLFLDTFTPKRHSPAFEEAVSLAASFACDLASGESLLDLVFVGADIYTFTAGRGMGRPDGILEILASVAPCEDKEFEAVIPEIMGRTPVLSGCILILVSWDDSRRRLVRGLRAGGLEVIVLLVLEKEDEGTPDPGPMSDTPNYFFVLKAGRIEEGLLRS